MITPTSPDTHPRREFGTGQRLDRLLIGAAIGWGVVILILAIVYPIESINTGRPGVQPGALLIVALALAASGQHGTASAPPPYHR